MFLYREGKKKNASIEMYILPLLIHWLAGGCCCIGAGAGAPAGAPNISANGFPNCSRSSIAFDGAAPPVAPSAGPNRSTILPELDGGDDKKGFVAAPVGDDTFDC